MVSKPTPQKRERPLLRVLSLIIQKAHNVSLWLIIASTVGLIVLPLLDRSIRFDEKGLLVGASHPTVGISADADAAELTRISLAAGGAAAFQRPGAADALATELRRVGLADTQLTLPTVTALGHAGGPPSLCRCANVHTRLRSPRGDGLEALAIVTPVAFAPQRPDPAHDGRNQTAEGAELALRAAASIVLHMARGHVAGDSATSSAGAAGGGRWLVRDLLWVVPDLSCGAHQCLTAWVRQYYEDAFAGPPGGLTEARTGVEGGVEMHGSRAKGQQPQHGPGHEARLEVLGDRRHGQQQQQQQGTVGSMVRGGVIQQALVLEALAGASYDTPELLVVGHDGLLPKLDMFYLLRYLFNYPVSAALWRSDQLEGSQRVLADLLQGWIPPRVLNSYVRRLLTGLQFAWQQAVGQPAGAHAAFKDFMVDAASVRLVQRHVPPGGSRGPRDEQQLRHRATSLAYSLELSLRSLNNLVERVHHSSFLYVLTDLDRYVSVERYVAPAVALAAAVQLQAAWSMTAAQRAVEGCATAAAVAGHSGAASSRIWAIAAARVVARTAVLAAAAAGVRALACEPSRWCWADGGEGRDGDFGPPWAVAVVTAARSLLEMRLSTLEGLLAAAAVLLSIGTAAVTAERLAGRLMRAAAPMGAGSAAAAPLEVGVTTAGAISKAAGVLAGKGSAPRKGGKAAAASPDRPAGQCLGPGEADEGEKEGKGKSSLGVGADGLPEAEWHAERVVVLTATAAAMTALVCLNWAAAVVAGAYVAPLALWQGWAVGRMAESLTHRGERGGASGSPEGGVLRQRVFGVFVRVLWAVFNPLAYLLLVDAATSSAGFGGSGSWFGGTVAGYLCGVSATNYWYGSVVVGSFWLFGMDGSFRP